MVCGTAYCAAAAQFNHKVAERNQRRYRRRGADAELRRWPLEGRRLLPSTEHPAERAEPSSMMDPSFRPPKPWVSGGDGNRQSWSNILSVLSVN